MLTFTLCFCSRATPIMGGPRVRPKRARVPTRTVTKRRVRIGKIFRWEWPPGSTGGPGSLRVWRAHGAELHELPGQHPSTERSGGRRPVLSARLSRSAAQEPGGIAIEGTPPTGRTVRRSRGQPAIAKRSSAPTETSPAWLSASLAYRALWARLPAWRPHLSQHENSLLAHGHHTHKGPIERPPGVRGAARGVDSHG